MVLHIYKFNTTLSDPEDMESSVFTSGFRYHSFRSLNGLRERNDIFQIRVTKEKVQSDRVF